MEVVNQMTAILGSMWPICQKLYTPILITEQMATKSMRIEV
jgi:hypothetical protein